MVNEFKDRRVLLDLVTRESLGTKVIFHKLEVVWGVGEANWRDRVVM